MGECSNLLPTDGELAAAFLSLISVSASAIMAMMLLCSVQQPAASAFQHGYHRKPARAFQCAQMLGGPLQESYVMPARRESSADAELLAVAEQLAYYDDDVVELETFEVLSARKSWLSGCSAGHRLA